VVSLCVYVYVQEFLAFISCEAYEELEATIQEVEKCSKQALQIATGKQRGSEEKMNVEELVQFLEQVESLPAKIPEAIVQFTTIT